MPNLNLSDAWKDIPAPQPDADHAPMPDPAEQEIPATSPITPPGKSLLDISLPAPGDLLRTPPAVSSSPQPSKSIFDTPLPEPGNLLKKPRSEAHSSSLKYQPDSARLETLHAMLLSRHNDPELDVVLEKNPTFRTQATLFDDSLPAKAAAAEQILRELTGEKNTPEPGLYFLANKEKLPQVATRQEALAAVYDHYTAGLDKRYQENKKRRADYQANRTAIEAAVPKIVAGLLSGNQLQTVLTPEQISIYNKEFDPVAVSKAAAAFAILKKTFAATSDEGLRNMVSQRTAMQITSVLSDDDGTGKLTISEPAYALFETSLKKLMDDVKEQSGNEWSAWHNLKLALFNPAQKADASLATGIQLSGQQQLLVPFDKKHNKIVFGLSAQTIRDYQTYVKNDQENSRILGLLSTGQDLGNQTSDTAPFGAKVVNCLGSVAGQTAPFFIPYAGWGLALASAYDDKRNRAYYEGLEPGTAEWSAFVDAAASTAVEKISFGAIGKLSRAGSLLGKLPFAAKAQQTLTSSLWKRILFETGAGIAEETIAEPTAEAIIQWAVRNNLAPLAGLDVGKKYNWDNYWQELSGMLKPEQLMATALFVGGLAGLQAPSLRKAMETYSRSPEMIQMQGVTRQDAERISKIDDPAQRIQAIQEAQKKVQETDPAQVQKNAADGLAAFRSFAEVKATVESEAYKIYQKERHLPQVEEKLDQPGTYTLTTYDKETGNPASTQEVTADQLASLFGRHITVQEKEDIGVAQSMIAANAYVRTAEATGQLQTQDMLQWGQEQEETKQTSPAPQEKEEGRAEQQTDPAETKTETETENHPAENITTLGKIVRATGTLNQQTFTYLANIATQEYTRRTQSGMTEQEALQTPFSGLSPYVPLVSMIQLDAAFQQRLKIAENTTGEENLNQTRLFKMRTSPGSTPADTLLMLVRGNVGSREALEDLFEWKLDNITQGDPARLQTVGALLRDTQASLHKLGFTGQFITPDGPLAPMQIVEAMSKLALSDTLTNSETLPLPQWQKDLLQYHINTLGDADYLINLGNAWNEGRQKGTVTDDIADILRDLGHQVRTVFDHAKIEQQDIQAWRDAQAIVNRRDPSGSPTATQIRQQQKQDAQAERNHITTTDSTKRLNNPDTPNPSGKNPANAPNLTSDLPPSLQQVFPAGASYNPAAQTWLGMVPVDKLRLSPEVPQVKVNSGKKGVVNPLVGDYRADAPPIYVWKRNNGRLEVVSGRHRLDLAQRTGTENIAAYVYEEDARHDAKWARLLDYEQNMQDDQADELTAAIYVRETRLSDDELTRRGLTRSGTKSRRGLLIGREAREDLWTRFKSTAIKAQDAEAICLLTQYIQNKDRIDAIQATAASDLANGKTLDFIAAKIQLMIHAAADGQMVQGLISFGETFEADMEKAAEYVSRCIGIINDHINAIKGVRTISKKGSVLATEGITAGLSADPAERLKELELLKTMYEKIGLYENLRLRAFTWDGHTQPDPIGDHRLEMQSERARAEEEAAASQEEENRKASEALTPGFGFSLTTSRSPESTFNALWKQAAKELNTLGSTSFALNGQRVALHTISHDNFTQALDLGGMPNPAIQIADIHSGPTHYAEIACILHPDLIDPAKTPGARIWQGDSWTRMMPEKVTEDGDSWEDEDRTEKDTPWFYDENGDLLEWNRDNLDQYMKFKHLGSYLPHNMTIDDVLDNYGEEGGAFPLVLASQAYAVEFDSIRQAAENDNHAYQIDRQAAEIAFNDLQNQFNTLITSYYVEPRSLQKFIMKYWQKDTFPETVAQALINEELLDDPGTHYDEDTEEYDDLRQTNESTVEEVADFIIACRTSAKPYYEAAHGGWLSPSDFTGFIIPTHLEETLRPQLEQRGLPVYTYDLTQEEANLLNNPWLLTKKPWLKDDIDERRNDAIRDFLEDNDVTFSLIPEDSRATSQNLTSTAASPLGLRPVAIAAAWNEVGQSEPVAIPIPRETEADQQGYSKLARTAFISLRAKTRQKDSLPQQSIRRREELAKPFLRTADNRTIFLGERDWSRFISSSPDARTLAAMSTLESLITTARYIHTVPEFDASPGNQIKARHYYLGKTNDPIHGTSLVLLTLREDTRGTYLEFLEAEQAVSFGKKNGSASSLTDFGLIHRAARRSLPASTLHTISQFVNHIDEQGRGVNAFLAPNGQPTNLTPDQWFLTRTKPFLDYFGDWLRDPSHASVVLDENGEPLICHRGLKKNYNPGVIRNYTWVSSSRSLSEEYAAGGTILDLFISARRPFHFPDGLTRLTAAQFRQTLKAELARETAKGKITPAQSQSASAQFDSLIHGDKETESFKIWEHYKEIKDILATLGYDAVATEEGGVMTYGLFRPGQAKSSAGNCGTYDITIPDITFSLSPEESLIAQQAKEDGTWLRAPNGNPSRLDPKLWATVRTRAFLTWFGDWIHDPEHASRAVDDNGEPMLIYHGSNYDFTEFDPTLAGENFDRQDLDNGFLFTSTNSDDARKAAESAREYQNQQNMDWDSEIPEEELFSEDDYQEYILFANTRNPLVYDLVANENIFYLGIDPTEPYIWDDPRFALNAQREFHEGDDDGNDYDAILLNGKNSTWLLARQSKQLKSAYHNRGTFDPTDPDITFSLSPEESLISQQAKEEGSWLMAPNGNPSRLTENQWLQVRTKAFRDWFGDWLHDPEHASRVTDDNGEPLIVYHGTSKAGFTVFDNRKGSPYSDTPENSHFFTSDPEVAASYSSGLQREPSLGKSPSFEAPGMYPCFLNLRSPLEEDFEGDWWDNRGEPWYDLYDHETKKDIPPPNGEQYWKSEEDAIQYAKAHGITDYMLPRASSSRTTHTVVQEAIEGGHDGTIIRNIIDPGDGSVDQESDIYVVLRPEQIKSATQNRGTFDSSNPDITFSLTPSPSNLAAVHSISPDKLLAADQLGGLPLPSIAVTRLDKPYTWGGKDNIYLVGSPSLADPARGVQIHDRDMWSGVFPELRWNKKAENEREELAKQVEAATLRYAGELPPRLNFFRNALEGNHKGEMENKLRRTPGVHAVFAAERGYAPRPKTKKTESRLLTGDRQFWKEILNMIPWEGAVTLSPERHQDFLAAMERAMERFRQKTDIAQDHKEFSLAIMREELKTAREDDYHKLTWLALNAARYAGKTVPDQEANERRFDNYIAKHQKAFNVWVQDKIGRWFDPMPRIRENGQQATMDNITEYMLGRKRISSEKALTFSKGLLRAKRSRRFTTLDQIKKQRDAITTTEEHKQSIETANSLIQQFQSALDRIVNNFTAYDNAVEALSRVKGTPTRDKIADALAWIYYGSPHVQTIRQRYSLLDLGVEALQSLKEELRDYFEGVPRRAVLLDEFTHAILPETLKMNQQVRQILKRHKIKPLFHDGTLEDRTRTMTSLIGSGSSFSLAPNESRAEQSGNDPAYLRILSADFMETLSEEELTIVQTAMEQGTYLLAPNGQPSRLTPRQWVQVRTKAFKNWFGDWQTDIWNSSRVTDRNGEPLVVYHGSRHAGFTSFDSSKGKISSDAPFGTTFFSDNPAVAFSYSGDLDEPHLHNPSLLEGIYSPPGLYPCFLNLREPWGVDFEGAYWDGTGQSLFEFYDNETEEFITPPSGEDFWSSEKVIREYALEHGYTNYEIYNSEGARTTNTIVQDALNMGLDGAVICNVIDMGSRGSDHLESNIYVAFRPEQIKSATQNRGTFDPANPDITFSVIGPHAETWGNYKDKTFEGRDDGKLRAEIDTSQASLLRERPERDMTSLLSLLNTFKTHTPETNLIGSPVMKLYRNTVEFDEYFKNSGASQEERDTLYKAIMEEYGFDREAKQESSSALENSIRELTAPCRQVHQALLDALEKNPLTAKLIRASRNTRPVYQGVEETILAFLARGEDRLFLDALREAGEWKTYRLENILDFPELFTAYPSLRDINIVFQDQIPNDGSGFFRKEDNAIVLRTPGKYATPSDLLSTILHEIQHVIQTIEGYARGGSPEGAARLFFSAWEDRLKKLRTYADSLSPSFVSLYQAQRIAQAGENPPEGTELQKQLRREGSSITAERKRRLITRYLKNELDQVRQNLASQMTEGIPDSLRFPAEQLTLPTAEETLADEGKSLWKIILQAENLRAPLQTAIKEATLHLDEQRDRFAAMGGQIGAYRRLAGEIEARNVPHRMYWSATNRTQTPFNDTLEYPGEAITSFSLTSLKQIVSSLSAPTMQATRAAQLVKDFDAAAENWRRVMSAKEDQPGSRTGAELFGVINSLLSSARYVLPHGYRSRVHLMMQWASVYAAMAETGEIPTKGTLQTSDTFYKKFMENVINDTSTAATEEDARQIIAALGNKRLDRTMGKILDRVRDQLVYFAKDELLEKTMKRVEAVYPKKEPGKKSPRGRMEAEAYRNLASYRKMLDSSAEYKAQAMTLLESQYENEQDETALTQCERDILAWKTYGDYKGMSLPQAQAAMEKLLEYILTGRNAWDRKIEQERSRTKYTARRIAQNLPRKNSATSRAIARIAGRTRLGKCLASLPYNFMSYSHLMLALEPILGQRFSRARIQDITDANAALLNESNDRAAWLSSTIRETANLKTESQAEQWLVNFDTPEKTGIILMPEITLTTALTIEQAQDWLSLSKEQRADRRQEIRLRDERTETLTENIPQEEDIPLLQDALAVYLARSEAQRDRQQVITVERTVPNEEAAGPLTCSRDCALFAILLHEQKDYADQYDEEGNLIRKGFLRREGFDDEGIAALYEFVGSIGLTYGYALRKKLNDKGHTLAQIYEQRMGVPFTLKENYFRASFDRNSTREKDALIEPKSALGGGKYGLLIDRINHNENLDWSKSATLVFLTATAEQDNYIYTSHITADWRTLLRNKQLEQKLRQHLGEDIMGKISGWMDIIDGASLENNRAFLHLSRMQGMLQRAFAISVLSGNGYVLLKQSSAILHGFHAGWVPSSILEKADGTRELAHRHITFSRYLYHLAASKMGMGAISLKTLAATPYFTARMRKQGHILAQIGNQMPGQQYSRFEKPQEWAMGRIEVVDVKANLHAMHALVNAYYAAARELNDKADSPFTDDQLRQAAINQVGQSLELGAQPLTKTQKSMSQAAGGILSKLAFVMKSEQLNKLGLMAAEWKTGSARNRVCAAQSWLALGVTSSLLAWFIAWLKGMDDEEDDETKLKKYAVTALLGDLTTIPLAGEAVNTLASLVTGERVFADSYARTLIDVGGITRTTKKEYQHLAGNKEMEWDAHFNNLTALVRFSGVGGTLSRSTSPVLSSYGALSLSAATGANITRTSKDLLTHAFKDPETARKKDGKNKKHKASFQKKEFLLEALKVSWHQ